MPIGSRGGVPTHFRTLFTTGPIGDLSDVALLERFLAARDDAAFEALLLRHGPMVLRFCRARLADPDEIDNAFQSNGRAVPGRARVRPRPPPLSHETGTHADVSAKA
jgi:hypothetical protein